MMCHCFNCKELFTAEEIAVELGRYTIKLPPNPGDTVDMIFGTTYDTVRVTICDKCFKRSERVFGLIATVKNNEK